MGTAMSTYLEDRLSCAAEHIRAAMEHIKHAAEGDFEGFHRFAPRLFDAGAGRLETIAQECELIAMVLDREVITNLQAAE